MRGGGRREESKSEREHKSLKGRAIEQARVGGQETVLNWEHTSERMGESKSVREKRARESFGAESSAHGLWGARQLRCTRKTCLSNVLTLSTQTLHILAQTLQHSCAVWAEMLLQFQSFWVSRSLRLGGWPWGWEDGPEVCCNGSFCSPVIVVSKSCRLNLLT